jgi:hypothetical protein
MPNVSDDKEHPTLPELVETSNQLKEQSVQIIRQLGEVLSQLRQRIGMGDRQPDSTKTPRARIRKPR